MGTLAQNLHSNSDRLRELAAIFEQAAANNKWGDLLTILPQIQDVVVSSTIHLVEMEPQAVATVLLSLRKNITSLEDAIEPAVADEPEKQGQVSDTPNKM